MPTDRKFRILRRTEFVSLDGEERAVFYKKIKEYKSSRPGNVSRYLQTSSASVDDYFIEVIENGDRKQSYSAREWLQLYPNTKWQ